MPEKRYWLDEDDRHELREIRRDFRGQMPRGADIPDTPAPRGRGGGILFYKAAEDLYSGRDWFYVNACTRAGVVASGATFVKMYTWGSALANMRAGYQMMGAFINGELCPIPTECIPATCATSGASITLDPSSGDATEGTVDVSYTFTGIITAGLTSAATAANLPPGLTLSGTTISGTPTTAGTYYVVLTGPKTGGCDVKRIVKITIVEPPPEEP